MSRPLAAPKNNYQLWRDRADPSLPSAKAMRRLRKKTGLSQRQFGKLSKFSQGYLGMIERGICQPKYNTMTRVIKALCRLGVPCTHEDFGFVE